MSLSQTTVTLNVWFTAGDRPSVARTSTVPLPHQLGALVTCSTEVPAGEIAATRLPGGVDWVEKLKPIVPNPSSSAKNVLRFRESERSSVNVIAGIGALTRVFDRT